MSPAPPKYRHYPERWYSRADPRMRSRLDELVRQNGGPLLRFKRSHGGLTYSLPCGEVVTQSTLRAMQRRGWVRELEPFDRATWRETWMVNESGVRDE